MTKFFCNQIGFTLIEVVIGIAISSLLGGGIVTAVYQMGWVNDMSNARVSAVKQVENALYYINRDVQMAQQIQTNLQGYWLKLSWSTPEDNALNEVTYSVQNGVITRRQSINGSQTSQKEVASHIVHAAVTAPNYSAIPPEKVWTIQVVATTYSGHQQVSETRQIEIIPRPGS
jgi:prepilin-type N-terminal cleavage/methylation domain-containing protein